MFVGAEAAGMEEKSDNSSRMEDRSSNSAKESIGKVKSGKAGDSAETDSSITVFCCGKGSDSEKKSESDDLDNTGSSGTDRSGLVAEGTGFSGGESSVPADGEPVPSGMEMPVFPAGRRRNPAGLRGRMRIVQRATAGGGESPDSLSPGG